MSDGLAALCGTAVLAVATPDATRLLVANLSSHAAAVALASGTVLDLAPFVVWWSGEG
ncbi:MAG: hypothetical protein U1E40_16130 [Amaricoccus sp.]